MNVMSRSLVVGMMLSAGEAYAQGEFRVQEATIDSFHAAIRSGQTTCEQAVGAYLERIDAYNLKGPTLRAVLTVNPKARELARQMDRDRAKGGRVEGSLYCVPVVLKDNFDTADMPTTGGNTAMKNSSPTRDAFTVARMKQAGAIILGKTNLQEFARGGVSISSLGGQVLNPYDLTRNPGGSSGGTGAALAANLAMVGTGSDTGQSIRSPASANSLVGVRPTRGLISRSGVMPNSFTQDEIGPIARTVTDAARLLDVMVGFDTDDAITGLGVGRSPSSYVSGLKPEALKGARIGLLTNYLGTDERHQDVTKAMESLATKMEAQGAIVVRFKIDDLAEWTKSVATDSFEAKAAFDSYLKSLPTDAPVKSFQQLVSTKTASPYIQATMEKELSIADGMSSDSYKTNKLNREKLRINLASKMAELNVSAILYPMQSILVTQAGSQEQPERNGVLSNATGMPAVTFQAGFSAPSKEAPVGVPIGAELLGRDYTEQALLAYAFAYEQAYHTRKPPLSTP